MMDKKFLMGSSDGLVRSISKGDSSTSISSGLHANLVMTAMRKSLKFYADFFDKSILDIDYDKLIDKYGRVFSNAHSLGLFKQGGIGEKDHLNLWCLGHVLSPEVYVESGVFIGSSLHAFIESPAIKKIFAIDPNLSKLKIPKKDIPGGVLIDDRDFSQINIDLSGGESIVFFDDHIDTADRILQASEKGFRYALFDDSTGFEGICQRLYPAVPTIPMIMNAELLNPGDTLSWTFNRSSETGFNNWLKRMIKSSDNTRGGTRVTLTVTQGLIDKCFRAKKLIRKCSKIPDLGEFIPQSYPERTVDISKFLVELNQD